MSGLSTFLRALLSFFAILKSIAALGAPQSFIHLPPSFLSQTPLAPAQDGTQVNITVVSEFDMFFQQSLSRTVNLGHIDPLPLDGSDCCTGDPDLPNCWCALQNRTIAGGLPEGPFSNTPFPYTIPDHPQTTTVNPRTTIVRAFTTPTPYTSLPLDLQGNKDVLLAGSIQASISGVLTPSVTASANFVHQHHVVIDTVTYIPVDHASSQQHLVAKTDNTGVDAQFEEVTKDFWALAISGHHPRMISVITSNSRKDALTLLADVNILLASNIISSALVSDLGLASQIKSLGPNQTQHVDKQTLKDLLHYDAEPIGMVKMDFVAGQQNRYMNDTILTVFSADTKDHDVVRPDLVFGASWLVRAEALALTQEYGGCDEAGAKQGLGILVQRVFTKVDKDQRIVKGKGSADKSEL